MKKTVFLLPLVVLMTSSCFSGDPTDSATGGGAPKEIELFPDNHFANGFNAYPGNKSFEDGTYPENDWTDNVVLKYDENTSGTSWQLQQAGCIYDLNDIYNPITKAYPERVDGYYQFNGVSNYVHVNPDIGEITLGLNASKEYEHTRKDKENWPHLLLQNMLTENISIAELESLTFTIDLEIGCEMKMPESEFNENLHTAQFLMYIIVNTNSAMDAGEYFWFGIPFYDYRYKSAMKPNAMIDNGTSGNTGKVIYQMGNQDFAPNGFELNKKYSIEIDLIEKFQDALAAAHSLDRMLNTTLEDLNIANMNIGWELPGTFDVYSTISNFSLKAVKM